MIASGGSPALVWWQVADLPMLLSLPLLLVISGFFSGSETALFALTHAERISLRQAGTLGGRAAERLLRHERMLLVTLLLGNTTVNVLYFVISSVLLMRCEGGPVVRTGLAGAFLLLIILCGEIAPKVIASVARMRFASLTGPVLFPIHEVIAPVRIVLADWIIAPLSRLMAPHTPPERLSDAELHDLLEISRREGAIASEEQRIVGDVLRMRQRRVRDVMTPRVRMVALPEEASREDVVRAVEQSRLSQIPVIRGDVDHVVGMLHVKRYLALSGPVPITAGRVMTPAEHVPDLATLDQLLDHLRRTRTQSAIVVDEYGGTEGIVAMEDVVEELVGDIVGPDEEPTPRPRLIGLGRWRVSGELSVRDWIEAFEVELESPKVATVAGLVAELLGRIPEPGDVVEIGPVRVEVERVRKRAMVSAIVTLREVDPEEPV